VASQEEASARASDLTTKTLVHHLNSVLIKAAVDLDPIKAAVDSDPIKEVLDSDPIKEAVEALNLISVQAKADQDSAHLDVDKALAPVDKAQEEDEASDPIAKVLEALVRDKEMIHGTTTAMMTTGAVIMEVRFYFVLKKLI